MSIDYKLTDPWCPDRYLREGFIIGGGSISGTETWSQANTAVAVPIIFPAAATIYSLSFAAGNGTGNYDLGLYTGAFARIQSTGSTAMSAAGKKTLTLTNDYRVGAGALFYAALVMSSTSGSFFGYSFGTLGDSIVMGIAIQTSALPLPDPFVPAVPGGLKMPCFAFGVR